MKEAQAHRWRKSTLSSGNHSKKPLAEVEKWLGNPSRLQKTCTLCSRGGAAALRGPWEAEAVLPMDILLVGLQTLEYTGTFQWLISREFECCSEASAQYCCRKIQHEGRKRERVSDYNGGGAAGGLLRYTCPSGHQGPRRSRSTAGSQYTRSASSCPEAQGGGRGQTRRGPPHLTPR